MINTYADGDFTTKTEYSLVSNDYTNTKNEYTVKNDFSLLDSKSAFQYRFLIPQSAAGAIISRKGENIKRLRTIYNCDINVPSSNGPERLLIIHADIDKLTGILTEIFDLVKDCMHAKVNDPKDINNGIIPEHTSCKEMDLRFLVSENVCGAIIGKGGEVIRRLTDTYRVTVFKVYQQMCPASSDRVIRLVGLPEDILSCLRAIHEVIMVHSVITTPRHTSIPIQGLKDTKSAREYDPNDFNEFHAVNYGGWLSVEGRRQLARMGGPPPATKGPTESGRSQPMLSNEMGARGAAQFTYPFFEGMPLGQMAQCLRPQSIMMELEQMPPDMASVTAVAASVGYAAVPMMNTGMPQGPIEISHVSLPNRLIGAIMGRGGSRINDIREASGARIDVDKDVMPNSDDRVITIQGSREQIQNAQLMLQNCVRKYGGKQL